MNIIKKIQKAVAFTLAETLVVMGIIGVVAALTIPNLNQSTGNRETVTKLKKVYANLEDAFGRATAVYGPVGEWSNGLYTNAHYSERFATRMADFMKIAKDCGSNPENGCFSSGVYKALDGEDFDAVESDEYSVLLADGTALIYYIGNFGSENIGVIKVDLDGPKGSNTAGKDYFTFNITPSGIYPAGSQKDFTDENLIARCFADGIKCAGWVIETGNMDYLKTTKGTCPNGTVLSWENTSCK